MSTDKKVNFRFLVESNYGYSASGTVGNLPKEKCERIIATLHGEDPTESCIEVLKKIANGATGYSDRDTDLANMAKEELKKHGVEV